MSEKSLAVHKSDTPYVVAEDQYDLFQPHEGISNYSLSQKTYGLRDFWNILYRHKVIILSFIIVITTIATIIALRAKSIYQASTVLEIGKDNASVVKSGDLLLQNEESDFATNTGIKTKMVLLKSHELLEDVITSLKLDQSSQFLPEPSAWSIRKLFNLPVEGPATPPQENSLSAKIGQEQLRTTAERARLDPFVKFLEENLNIEQVKETRVLKVSFSHTDPVIAAAVSDGISQNFIQRNFDGKTEKYAKASAWLDRSTLELKARVEKAEQELANYTKANNIFTTEGTSTLTTDKLAKLHDQVTRTEADRILKETLFEEVKEGRVARVPEAFATMTSKNSPRISELQKQLGELSTTEAQLSVHYGPGNPQIQEVRQQINAIKEQIETSRKLLEETLKVEYEHALRDEQSLKAALAVAKADAVNENQAAIQFSILKQEVDTAKSLYTEFLQKSNQTKIQEAEQYSNIRILDHAKVPAEASGPRRALTILLWLTISIIVGVGLSMLRELLDNTIKTAEDVAQYIQLSTLAVIPHFKPKDKLQFNELLRERSAVLTASKIATNTIVKTQITPMMDAINATDNNLVIREAYHSLRTSVILSTAGGPPKTILVTSSEAGDGKTTTAINLAMSLAELNAKVLIIDADMRRPSVHKVFGVERKFGLSTYLSGDIPVNKLIQNVNVPGLSLLSGGPIPPNPASLVSSLKMKELLAKLREHYDYIVIDSPPISIITDGIILSTIVDGVVLVVQANKSKRELVRRLRYDLTGIGTKIIGIVINKVNLKRDKYSDYYSHYYLNYLAKED